MSIERFVVSTTPCEAMSPAWLGEAMQTVRAHIPKTKFPHNLYGGIDAVVGVMAVYLALGSQPFIENRSQTMYSGLLYFPFFHNQISRLRSSQPYRVHGKAKL